MAGDWLKLHRSIMEHPVFQHDGLLRLWTYLLVKANWKPRDWIIPGTLDRVTIARGQLITGRETLFESLYGNDYRGESKPTARTVWRWLKTLESFECVTLQTVSNRCTLVTISKYTTYQDGGDDDVPPVSRSCPTDVQVVSNRCPTDVPPVSTLEERNNSKKERREEGKKATPAAPEMVLPFASDQFREAWTDFVAMRVEIRKPLKATAIKLSLAKLAAMGESIAIQSLRESTANQWQGLFEPKEQTRAGPNGNGQHDPRGNFAAREQFLLIMGDREHENAS